MTQQAILLSFRLITCKKASTQREVSGGISPNFNHTEQQRWERRGNVEEHEKGVAFRNARHTVCSLINLTELEATVRKTAQLICVCRDPDASAGGGGKCLLSWQMLS